MVLVATKMNAALRRWHPHFQICGRMASRMPMHEHDAIHTNHTAHIFKQNLQPNPVRIFGILQMAVATTRDGRDVVAAFFHFSKDTLGFARINQGRHSSRQNAREGYAKMQRSICTDPRTAYNHCRQVMFN
jgi:hypothetical protein